MPGIKGKPWKKWEIVDVAALLHEVGVDRRDAAFALGVSPNTITIWRKRGQMPAGVPDMLRRSGVSQKF